MYSSTEVDEIIETEVCNRLIRLSCAKMVSSKNERGGAKLHRNLLILHLLRRARNEQKRPIVSSPETVDVAPKSSSEFTAMAVSTPPLHCPENADMCSRVNEPVVYGNGYNPYFVYRTSDPMHGEIECNPVVDFVADSENYVGGMNNGSLQSHYNGENMQSEVKYASSSYEPVVEQSFDAKDDDDEEEEEDEEKEEYYELNSRQRKRKTSMSPSSSSTTPKKCCVEERQFTGLISVFNSGLSVVADQLLPRSTASPLLQSTSDQLVPLVRIACNPLIC